VDIAVFDAASLTPMLILEGHRDWVFDTAFISQNLLVSCKLLYVRANK
jgi:hypothetical protein